MTKPDRPNKPFKYLVVSDRWDDCGYLYEAEPYCKPDFEGYVITSRTLIFTPNHFEGSRKDYEEMFRTLSYYALDVLLDTKSIKVLPTETDVEVVRVLYGTN